jgi:dihydrofolate synthase / folylpolyglutamate synthase
VKFGIDRMRLLSGRLGPSREGGALRPRRRHERQGLGLRDARGDPARAGWRTGLYTSPHLVRLGERVQVDRAILSEEEITAFVRELQPVADGIAREGGPDDRPSFFEFMTAMAFLQFARKALRRAA